MLVPLIQHSDSTFYTFQNDAVTSLVTVCHYTKIRKLLTVSSTLHTFHTCDSFLVFFFKVFCKHGSLLSSSSYFLNVLAPAPYCFITKFCMPFYQQGKCHFVTGLKRDDKEIVSRIFCCHLHPWTFLPF